MKFNCIVAALSLAVTCQAHALGRLADVTVVDRNSGATLPTHYYRGEHWVAGAPGAKYAIVVRNRMGERVLAVTAVDGVNVLTGDTAGWDQAGYVFSPAQTYQITGWRKSNAEVAAFEFTASPNSYAERTGRPANVGVIGVALFRERPAEPPVMRWPEPAGSGAGGLGAQKSLPAESSLPFDAERRAAAPAAAAPAPRLGTGHGQREASYVTQTEFARLQPNPNEVIRIRYDSRENLVAMGVIRERNPQPPVLNPFPESPTARFVPDPPPYR
ncbi:MAG TPA: hypothetical protein VLJ57_01535 [Burkholderiaceae bacterium]|nr:hypothetical protein [Burkholderiaceae bacterium]